jgi:hypothetical protein
VTQMPISRCDQVIMFYSSLTKGNWDLTQDRLQARKHSRWAQQTNRSNLLSLRRLSTSSYNSCRSKKHLTWNHLISKPLPCSPRQLRNMMCFIPKQYAECLCSTSIHVFCKKYSTLKCCRAFIPHHPGEVLEYAVKHDYAKVADDAAFGSIDCKAIDMARHLSLETFQAWVCLPSSTRK